MKVVMENKLLSIIVPVYNVQGYLHDCIDSLLEQNIDNQKYEILLLDDGSKDKSKEIIDRYSTMYDNISAFHFKNSGLGATRNKGINLATGEYIAFLDSDDFVPKKAYSSLLESAKYNNAEIVTGPVERFEKGKYTRSGLHKKVKFDASNGFTLANRPSLLYDATSTNKIYNLDFLKKKQLYFPENIVYEDIYFTLRAYAKANLINTIEDVTYFWRIRNGETVSITQDRFNIQGYKDRIKTCFDTLHFLLEETNEYLAKEFEKRIITFDLPLFFPEYENTNLLYAEDFTEITKDCLADLDSGLIKYCDYRKQVIYEAIKLDDINTVLNYSQDHVKSMKLIRQDGELKPEDEYLSYEYLSKVDFNSSDILRTKVKDLILRNDSLIINVEINSPLVQKIDSEKLSALIFTSRKEKNIDIKPKENNIYEIIIGIEDISKFQDSGLNKIKLIYNEGSLYNEKILGEPGSGVVNTTLLKNVGNYSYRVNYNFAWELFIEKQKISNVFTGLYVKDNNLIFEAEQIGTESVFKLKNHREQSIIGEVLKNSIIFDLDQIIHDNRLYRLTILQNGITSHNYKFNKLPPFFQYVDANNYYEYVVRAYRDHSISVNKKEKHSSIEALKYRDGKLTVRYASPQQPEYQNAAAKLIFKSTNGKVTKFFNSKKIGDYGYESTIDLNTSNIEEFLTYGTYVLSVEYYKNEKILPESLLLNEKKKVNFPYDFDYKDRKYNFTSKNGNLIYLKKVQVLNKYEDTKKKREMIYKYIYPLLRLLPLNRKKAVYYSYWGEQYADSPKVLYECVRKEKEDFKNIWILNDTDLPIEGNGIKVKKNSLKYWYHLATAKYFVQNTNMPVRYEKRKKQLEIQTFHGTFMKTMGFDTPEFKYETDPHKINEFQKKVNNWDYITIPSDYMKNKAREAFKSRAVPIKTGIPRNDKIFEALNKTNSIKDKLNIPHGKKIALYAPTWRESKTSDINMDIDYMQKKLGDDYVLLVRVHYMVSNNMRIRKNFPFAIDVSSYPSIEELYAISDILLTDYSSVMFDYAYLKRPMIFYAYDLEKYLYGERGVYLDYEDIVPGPVVRTTQGIVDKLLDSDNLTERYKLKYEQFYDEFCQYGRDGDSARKTIRNVFKN